MSRLFNKQFRSSATFDFSGVPTNVFSLRGDAFYSLVEELTSKDMEELPRIQKISNVRCFLNKNPLAFFDINSDDPPIIQLQNRLSFKVKNSKNVVLAGVHGYLRYLQKLFDSLLMKKKNKRINPDNSTATNKLLHQVPSTGMQISSLPIDSSTTADLSTIDHHNYLNHKIKSWWEKSRNQYGLENHLLTEPDDYQIIIKDKSA